MQNPGTQPEVALVFRSIKGTGKGLFGRALCQAFGQHGLQISSHSHLTGNFNRHLQDCAMLFADEAFWPGDKSAEGTLKRIITEPTLIIEPKGVDSRSEPNRLHVILAANAEWVVPASMRERRFAVFAASEKYIGKKKYFTPLYQQLEKSGIAAMMYDLLALELGDWHPRNDIPNTDALIEQQRRSLDEKDQRWASLLTEGVLPGAQQENLRRSSSFSLFEKARSSSPRLKYISDHELGHYLISRGCHRVRVKGGPRGWEFPPLAEVRAEWAKTFPTDWDDPERDWEREQF